MTLTKQDHNRLADEAENRAESLRHQMDIQPDASEQFYREALAEDATARKHREAAKNSWRDQLLSEALRIYRELGFAPKSMGCADGSVSRLEILAFIENA